MNPQIRDPLSLPNKGPLLLHSCCAPCAGEIMESLIESKINFSIFYYNPNIHPKKEYNIRKEENIEFAKKHNIEFIDADYDIENWFNQTKGMEFEPERGVRCTKCFDIRFIKTAEYAEQHGFNVICSTLGLSRWKNMDQINECGIKSAKQYKNIIYWTHNWRKKGGSKQMYKIAKKESFYKQEYCGCVYSLRDTNQWRKKTDRKPIRFGEEFYNFDC